MIQTVIMKENDGVQLAEEQCPGNFVSQKYAYPNTNDVVSVYPYKDADDSQMRL